MKRLLISLVVAGLLLSFGCRHCPNQDVYMQVMTPYGPMIIWAEKGALDKEFEGKWWLPVPEEVESEPEVVEGDDV